jgi:hypothetical protein
MMSLLTELEIFLRKIFYKYVAPPALGKIINRERREIREQLF